MECTVAMRTILSNDESKVLHKLLGSISVSAERDCGMSEEEINLLSGMYYDMNQALVGVSE